MLCSSASRVTARTSRTTPSTGDTSRLFSMHRGKSTTRPTYTLGNRTLPQPHAMARPAPVPHLATESWFPRKYIPSSNHVPSRVHLAITSRCGLHPRAHRNANCSRRVESCSFLTPAMVRAVAPSLSPISTLKFYRPFLAFRPSTRSVSLPARPSERP